MFHYLKNLRKWQSGFEKEQERKPKKDKVFIFILIVFAGFAAFSILSNFHENAQVGVRQEHSSVQLQPFKFSLLDGIILGGAVGGGIVLKVRKGKKK